MATLSFVCLVRFPLPPSGLCAHPQLHEHVERNAQMGSGTQTRLQSAAEPARAGCVQGARPHSAFHTWREGGRERAKAMPAGARRGRAEGTPSSPVWPLSLQSLSMAEEFNLDAMVSVTGKPRQSAKIRHVYLWGIHCT